MKRLVYLIALIIVISITMNMTACSQKQKEKRLPEGPVSTERSGTQGNSAALADFKRPIVTSAVKVIPVQVIAIVDGDTIKVEIEGRQEKVRLIGVDTPETVHPAKGVEAFGAEAKEYTTNQLMGKQVYLEKDVDERDRYGRLLAYVWLRLPDSDNDKELQAKLFNARLLIDGYARLMTVPPNVKYVDSFIRYQTTAREENRGLWGSTFSGTTTNREFPQTGDKNEASVLVHTSLFADYFN